MTDRGLPYPFLHRPEGALLDLSLHYPRHLLDRLQHFAPFPPQPLHIKRERRDSTPFLQGVKQEPGEEGEGHDVSYHREEQFCGERELPRSFSLPAPREPGHAPERQVSLEGGREGGAGGAAPKPEASSRTVIGRLVGRGRDWQTQGGTRRGYCVFLRKRLNCSRHAVTLSVRGVTFVHAVSRCIVSISEMLSLGCMVVNPQKLPLVSMHDMH